MTLVQFLIAGLIILFFIKTLSDFNKKRISRSNFLFWFFLWLAILIVALMPQVTNFLAELIGVKRGTDVATYFSILIIFFILFKVLSRLEKINQEITEIVRHISTKE
jgi:hypothetical protein